MWKIYANSNNICFRPAMELNPQVPGPHWPIQVKKIGMPAPEYEEWRVFYHQIRNSAAEVIKRQLLAAIVCQYAKTESGIESGKYEDSIDNFALRYRDRWLIAPVPVHRNMRTDKIRNSIVSRVLILFANNIWFLLLFLSFSLFLFESSSST